MQTKKYISRFIGMLLIISVLAAHFSISGTSHTKKESEKPQITAVTQDVVIPNFDFDFAEISIVWDLRYTPILLSSKICGFALNVFIENSYFDKLFEHIIAINAP